MQYAMFVVIFAAASVYALLLSTRYGRVMTEIYTWLTVVIGTGMVLTIYTLMAPSPDPLIWGCFVAGGLPIVMRSLWEETRRELRFRKTITGENDDANQG